MSYEPSDYSSAPPALRDFLFYLLTIKGRSPLTVENYYLDLRCFFRYIKQQRKLAPSVPFEQIDISDVDLDLIRSITLSDAYGFLNFTYQKRRNTPTTRCRKVSSLRTFFKYLTNNAGILKNNPMEHLEQPAKAKTLSKHLSLEQSFELLHSFDTSDPFYTRDFCMITLFLNCGMRLSELTGLDLSSISGNTLTVIGKGNKERQLYLNDACLQAIAQYLPDRGKLPQIVDKNALFLNRNGKRLGQRRVQQLVTEQLEKAGLSGMGFSTHKLRHTAATLMYQYGEVDIRVLQEILGHVNLNTTQIYTHVSSRQKESAIESNPVSKFKK